MTSIEGPSSVGGRAEQGRRNGFALGGVRMLAGAQGQPILNNLMHRDTVAVFREIASDVSIDEHAAIMESLPRTAQAAREVAGHWDFSAPSKVVDEWLASRYPSYADSDILRLRKAIVARLCLYHFSVGDQLP